ncbi:MAG: hypothetical protein V7672_10785 [Brevundimonas sp.]|uniref:hypothetical protein n=1 Tax=Brevundimonas sp. TaxID=1871086 RepID=UPI0030039ECE
MKFDGRYNLWGLLFRAVAAYALSVAVITALLYGSSPYLQFFYSPPGSYITLVVAAMMFLTALGLTWMLVRGLFGHHAFILTDSGLVIHTFRTIRLPRDEMQGATYSHEPERGLVTIVLLSGSKRKLSTALFNSPRDLTLALEELGARQTY